MQPSNGPVSSVGGCYRRVRWVQIALTVLWAGAMLGVAVYVLKSVFNFRAAAGSPFEGTCTGQVGSAGRESAS
jgi:hypothetical protein